MLFSLYDVLLIAAIIQGLVAVPLLLLGREKRVSNVFLALAILSFCFLFFKMLIYFNGLSGDILFRYFPNAFELTTAPLFYLYLRALIEKGFTWKPWLLVHFIPFFIAQGFALYVYAAVYGYTDFSIQDQIARSLFYPSIKEIEDWAIVISIISYLYAGYKKYKVFQYQVQNSTADSVYPTLSWLKSIIVLTVILLVILLVNMLLSRFTNIGQVTKLNWQLYFIYIAGMTYYIGFMAFRQKSPDLNQIYEVELQLAEPEPPRAENQQAIEALNQLLYVDKIYQNPTLNLRQVADSLAVSPSTLSYIINNHFNKSFRELINDYRIIDIQEKLLRNNNKASILSLALESGFNSEASFYRVFKNYTGQTPKAFISANAQQTSP